MTFPLGKAVPGALVEDRLAMEHLSTQNSRMMDSGRELKVNVGSRWPLLILLMSTVVAFAYCRPMSHRQETVPNRPQSRVFKVKPDVVRKAVERTLSVRKFSLNTRKSTYNHLQTEWLEDGRYRSMVTADFKPLSKSRTELTLQLILQKRELMGEVWNQENEVGVDVYDQLMDDVLMETYRVIYDGA
jgi:hypothetical protein